MFGIGAAKLAVGPTPLKSAAQALPQNPFEVQRQAQEIFVRAAQVQQKIDPAFLGAPTLDADRRMATPQILKGLRNKGARFLRREGWALPRFQRDGMVAVEIGCHEAQYNPGTRRFTRRA